MATGDAYPNELNLASGLINAFGESNVANAYFKDDAHALLVQVQQKFSRASGDLKNFLVWQTKSKQSDNPRIGSDADKLLQAAVTNPRAAALARAAGPAQAAGRAGGSRGLRVRVHGLSEGRGVSVALRAPVQRRLKRARERIWRTCGSN